MREALFVKQNREKWQRFEMINPTDTDALAERFIEITNDLAYAKTFYPDSKTTTYLNGLASRLHQSVYVNKRERSNRFITFWKTELPLILFEHRKKLLYAFIFFMISYGIGFLSAVYDDSYVRLILGDQYVNMTLENISKGDPFGVYKSESPFSMFMMIAVNNIYVSLRFYVLGAIASLGTLVNIYFTGVMVGSFQAFFITKGLGTQFLLVVFIHGTLEISAIIVAGGAGLIFGNSILFPKTYSRLTSIKKGALDGLKVIMGMVPIIIIAAIFEGFVTRHTDMPIWLSIGILCLSASFMTWYVIIYPRKLNRQIEYNGTEN